MSVANFEKDPVEDLDYGFDLTDWLQGGEAIASVEISVDIPGVTLHDLVNQNNMVATWVAGGASGERARIFFKVTTTNVPPRIFNRSLTILIKRK
jgi:hypothetical protein